MEATAPSARAHHAGRRRGRGRCDQAPFGEAETHGGSAPMRGGSLDSVSRELNVAVHRLSEWRDRVLMAPESALNERERDERDDDIALLQAKVGEITMRPRRGDGRVPFKGWRSRFIMHLFLQNMGRTIVLCVTLSRACFGLRATISCNPIWTASVSGASTGIF